MIDTQDYLDYFEDLARRHLKIRHQLNGAVRFTSISIEDLINNIAHGVEFRPQDGDNDYGIMLLEDITGQWQGTNLDNMNDRPDGAFTILKHCPQEDFGRERAIYRECKKIAESLVGTMTSDYRSNANNVMQYLEPENGIRYMKVGPAYDNCFGMRVEFSFSKSIIFKHNPSDYIEE